MKKSILSVIGTRPEFIKMAPILEALATSRYFKSQICLTGQHTDLLQPFIEKLGITPDFMLEANNPSNTLSQSVASLLQKMTLVLAESKPSVVLVQGDTTSAFVAALAAFYARIPVAHIEAGLRTGLMDSPWPEEAHRKLVDTLSTYFFAPTENAKKVLLAEGVLKDKIWVVGNTSIDAVRRASKHIRKGSARTILATVHRRENHGEPLRQICQGILSVAKQFQDIKIQFVLHPNPAIHVPARQMHQGVSNIELLQPVEHQAFVELLENCLFVITDSGGIQEEAPFLGKPILVVRNTTERPEGVTAGTARLTGTRSAQILSHCRELIEDEHVLNRMSKVHFPYGDGFAAGRILNILEAQVV